MFDSKSKEFEIDNSKYNGNSMENMEQHTEIYSGSHQDFFEEEKNILDENELDYETFSTEDGQEDSPVQEELQSEELDTLNEVNQDEEMVENELGEENPMEETNEIVEEEIEDVQEETEDVQEEGDSEQIKEVDETLSSEETTGVEDSSNVTNSAPEVESPEDQDDEQTETEVPEQDLVQNEHQQDDQLTDSQTQDSISQSPTENAPDNQDELEECGDESDLVQNQENDESNGESEEEISYYSNEQDMEEISEYYSDYDEEISDVDSSSDFDEYDDEVQVFVATPRFIADDPRVPPEIKKASGTISQFGPTVGGVDLEFTSTASGIDQRYKFQGKAKAAFVLTGGVLDANVTISVLASFDENSMKYKYQKNGSQSQTTPTYLTDTLRNFLVKAANETIDDINGMKTTSTTLEYGVSAPIGIPDITHRAHLIRALRKVFNSNNGSKQGSTPTVNALTLTFKDLDETTPKQVTLVYNGQAIFPTSVDYARNMIIEDSLVNNLPNKTRALGDNTKASNVNFDPTKIAINFDIKSKDVKQGLKTNTNYEFIALNKNFTFFKDFTQSVGTNIKFLEGFTLSNFKTGKKVPLLETSWVKDNTTMEASSLIALDSLTSSDKLLSSIDFNSISKNTFLDYDDLVSATAQSVALKIGGASIKFNTLKVYDTDSTITKIEVEDDRSNKYPVSLIPISESDKSLGANPQINGLQRSTPYNFKKLHVTAQPEDTSVIKTFVFSMFSSAQGGTNVTADPSHNILLRTSSFYEPSLFIESTPIFVSVADGTISTTATSSFTLQAFLPKVDVELPNRVKMPAVSNDKTSLRYVIEVDNSDGRAGELTVNGLKGDENYKVQKFVGKDRNFYIVNLYNLSENRDYGFLIFELSYKDLDGRELIARKVLSEINRVISVTTTSGGTKTIQFPDYDQDNTTGPEKTGLALFNVTLFEQTLVEARRAEIPVFIDDMNSRFLRLEFVKPESNPRVEVKLENGVLKFINLEPKTDVVYKLDFIWKDKDGQEKALSKYAKIVTPDVQVVDVKSTSITTDQSSATILFTLYSQPKLPIVSVSLSEEKMKYTWDKDKLELVITNLKPKTEYKDIEVTFKLENGLTAKHKLDAFMTKDEIVPPKGKVADFVAKVYRIALNREPEINGWRFWVSKLESKEITVSQFINDLMVQDEFINRFLSKEDFIKMMYQIVLGRDSEEEGQKYWMRKYDEYKVEEETLLKLRMRIASEMINEKEFKEYVTSMGLRY